jgi:hypothetical protein
MGKAPTPGRHGRRPSPPQRTPSALEGKRAAAMALIVPALLAAVLVAPTVPFTYLFDDYDFLGRAATFHWGQLLPDPSTLFYRPISRELYFGFLYFLGPNHPLWGHAANAALVLLAVVLVGLITRKIAGRQAGYLAAVSYASLGALPILVGWASGSQDLLAIVFVLVALWAQLSGRQAVSLLAAACALFSKETAVAFIPAIAIARWLTDQRPHRVRGSLGSFGLVVAAWAAIHPGIRLLASGRSESGGSSVAYLSASGSDRWAALGKGLATLGNLPISGAATPWPEERNLTFVLAAAILVAGFWSLSRSRGDVSPQRGVSRSDDGRLIALGLLLAIPPLLMISMLVRSWQPYYLTLAAIGTSILLGIGLSRLPLLAAAALAIGFLALGIWCRGMDLGSDTPTERNVRPPMERLRRVEAGFRRCFPALDSPSHLYLSVFAPEDRVVSVHLFRFQALRCWYRNPKLDTMHPEWRRPDPPNRILRREVPPDGQHLAWVAPDLTVHEIDLVTMAPRTDLADTASYEYGATVRSFALGLAATGETDGAVNVLLDLPAPDDLVAAVNRRLAAALLLADGRTEDAARLTRTTPAIGADDAIEVAHAVLASPARRDIDAAVLLALGVAPADTAVVRGVMRKLAMSGHWGATSRFARRLLEAKPGDWEAQALLRWLRQGAEAKRVVAPVVADSLW